MEHSENIVKISVCGVMHVMRERGEDRCEVLLIKAFNTVFNKYGSKKEQRVNKGSKQMREISKRQYEDKIRTLETRSKARSKAE